VSEDGEAGVRTGHCELYLLVLRLQRKTVQKGLNEGSGSE
jgi:hypothetical protein